ncbi:hypothetical protein [Flavobacterium hungaricum]|uniref:Lipoprotein n=1 Tax=Flavobacterium hungaricum TaxID=2082725 RepID=A0ABR9TEZ3_9FLAO|nr:hypothetical protein [Flavobacterium hungaricum]MBE8723928.1 hypothetical protein [Flavobacterium hungaricum]
MKKYACLLIFSLLLNGCDDGDLTIATVEFGETIKPQLCSSTDITLLYKLDNQKAFLVQLPKDGLKSTPGTYTYDIDNTSYRALYRNFDGTVTTDNICGAIPPITPKVVEEWVAETGKIEIITEQIPSTTVAEDGSTKITGYNHNITFLNVIFNIPNSVPQSYPEYSFGTYTTSVTIPATLAFTNPEIASQCTVAANRQIYNYAASFYIMIDNIDPALLKEEETPAGQPRQGLIQTTVNKVYYKSVEPNTGSITADYFCKATPASPSIKEDWLGRNGTKNETTGVNESGIIEVTTTRSGSVYLHTIVLKNVTMTKGTGTFKLPTNFSLGRIGG